MGGSVTRSSSVRSGISSKHLFVAEQRHVYKVRLFGLERPEGNFQVGGLENMEMLPDVIHVEYLGCL